MSNSPEAPRYVLPGIKNRTPDSSALAMLIQEAATNRAIPRGQSGENHTDICFFNLNVAAEEKDTSVRLHASAVMQEDGAVRTVPLEFKYESTQAKFEHLLQLFLFLVTDGRSLNLQVTLGTILNVLADEPADTESYN